MTFDDMPATPFVPDVAHATVTLARVTIAPEARLAGDGWSDYVKPFRTLEDLHVQAAITAWLVGALRRAKGPHALTEQLVAHALTLRTRTIVRHRAAPAHAPRVSPPARPGAPTRARGAAHGRCARW